MLERHETLSQSVELLTKDIAELRAGLRELGTFAGQIAEGTARLRRIADIRENRITRLAGGES